MSFYEKNMLKHEAINVKTVMINQLRFWDYFLNQDRKSLYFQLLTMRNITAMRLLVCAYKKIKTF